MNIGIYTENGQIKTVHELPKDFDLIDVDLFEKLADMVSENFNVSKDDLLVNIIDKNIYFNLFINRTFFTFKIKRTSKKVWSIFYVSNNYIIDNTVKKDVKESDLLKEFDKIHLATIATFLL